MDFDSLSPLTSLEESPAGLDDALRRSARSAILLVVCDYDDVIARSAADPSAPRPDESALDALVTLAGTPCTHAAIVSGRSRADIARITGHPQGLHLVGSHGAELDGIAAPRSPAGLLDSLVSQVVEIASRWRGLLIERKPFGVALHYRNAREPDADAAIWALLNGPARMPGVHVRPGSKVFELCTTAADKGVALATLRQRTGATCTVFLGNEAADDDALRALGARDVGVHVGERLLRFHGHRSLQLPDVEAVSEALTMLAALRSEWAAGGAASSVNSGLEPGRTVLPVGARRLACMLAAHGAAHRMAALG